jgi:Ca2+ transporting ATPase
LLGIDYEEIRREFPIDVFTKVYTFNSARKSMSTVVPLPGGGFRLFTKGAAEIVLGKCSSILKEEGNVSPLNSADQRQIVSTVIKPMAGRALRTIALSYRCVWGREGGRGRGGGGWRRAKGWGVFCMMVIISSSFCRSMS